MTALRLCVEQCRRQPSPLTALDEYLRELRQKAELDAAEVAEVEATARRALAACSAGHSASMSAMGT
jgi:hypothetical protein